MEPTFTRVAVLYYVAVLRVIDTKHLHFAVKKRVKRKTINFVYKVML